MSLIKWEKKFSVDIARIDVEHRRLIDMINRLHEAMLDRKTDGVLLDIVDGMIDYARTHFRTEEFYMDEFEYPEKAVHKSEHAAFIEKAEDLRNRLDQGEMVFSLEVIRFLKDWLTNHIMVTDGKYAPFFKEKGLT